MRRRHQRSAHQQKEGAAGDCIARSTNSALEQVLGRVAGSPDLISHRPYNPPSAGFHALSKVDITINLCVSSSNCDTEVELLADKWSVPSEAAMSVIFNAISAERFKYSRPPSAVPSRNLNAAKALHRSEACHHFPSAWKGTTSLVGGCQHDTRRKGRGGGKGTLMGWGVVVDAP